MDRETGFTLVELMAAITLGALVTVMAHSVLTGVIDATTYAGAGWKRLHGTVNARRLLTKLIANVEVGPAPADAFRGQQHELAFSAWHTDLRAGVALRNLHVVLRDSAVLIEGLEYGAVNLVGDATDLDIDYLSGSGIRAVWLDGWHSTTSAPTAIRLRIALTNGSDTLLFRIGERG